MESLEKSKAFGIIKSFTFFAVFTCVQFAQDFRCFYDGGHSYLCDMSKEAIKGKVLKDWDQGLEHLLQHVQFYSEKNLGKTCVL